MRLLVIPIFDLRQQWFNWITWALFLLIIAVDAVGAYALGWQINWAVPGLIAKALLILGAVFLVFTYIYREPRFALTIQIMMQFVLLTSAAAIFSYLAATLNMPLRDPALAAADRYFAFDWWTYCSWVYAHPKLLHLYNFSYFSVWGQMSAAFFLLFLSGQLMRLQHFCFCMFASVIVIICLAALCPALGAYGYYHIDPSKLPIGAQVVLDRMRENAVMMALRSGEFHTLDFHFEGLITFPSYHAALGILMMYVYWPFLLLRLPALVLNGLLVLSTPVEGGHYLVDILAGIVVMGAIIMLARKLLPIPAKEPTQGIEEDIKDYYTDESSLLIPTEKAHS